MCIRVSNFYMKIINNKHTLFYNRPTIHSTQRYNDLCELTNCFSKSTRTVEEDEIVAHRWGKCSVLWWIRKSYPGANLMDDLNQLSGKICRRFERCLAPVCFASVGDGNSTESFKTWCKELQGNDIQWFKNGIQLKFSKKKSLIVLPTTLIVYLLSFL